MTTGGGTLLGRGRERERRPLALRKTDEDCPTVTFSLFLSADVDSVVLRAILSDECVVWW